MTKTLSGLVLPSLTDRREGNQPVKQQSPGACQWTKSLNKRDTALVWHYQCRTSRIFFACRLLAMNSWPLFNVISHR